MRTYNFSQKIVFNLKNKNIYCIKKGRKTRLLK